MKKTVRLIYPQWQGGENPDYVFGAEMLSHIAPPCDEVERVEVSTDFNQSLQKVDGIIGGDQILANIKAVKRILEEKDADRVITYGGECSVSQGPFDYLSGKYGEKIGIIWLDAHPDISTIHESSHMNECVLGNLIGRNQKGEVTRVAYPYDSKRVIFAGLIEEDLRDMDKGVKQLDMQFVTPEELKQTFEPVLKWIEENKLEYLAIHWDLDVTSRETFRSTYPTEPLLDPNEFPAAIGRMELEELRQLFAAVSEKAEIVGLSITEHMPWDAMNLRSVMSEISIFKE